MKVDYAMAKVMSEELKQKKKRKGKTEMHSFLLEFNFAMQRFLFVTEFLGSCIGQAHRKTEYINK